MARRSSKRKFPPVRARRRSSASIGAAARYAVGAVGAGLALAAGSVAWDNAQKRQAILDALPPGYEYSDCAAVRAAGVAPLYRMERGFSDRLDRDGDGIGCEPYRGG